MLLPGDGMREREPEGMQRLPRQPGRRRAAVQRIGHQRMADVTPCARGSGGCARSPACSAQRSHRRRCSRHSKSVRAGLPEWRSRSTTAMRRRLRGSRPIGASTCARRALPGAVGQREVLARDLARCDQLHQARPSHARVRATTISPLVSLSSRCTMPARGSARGLGSQRQQAVQQRAAPVARRRMHHQPGRLVDRPAGGRPRTPPCSRPSPPA